MEKSINRLLVFTLVCGIFFAGITFLFRNAEHDSVSEGDRSFPLCEYIDVSLARLPVTVIPYDGEEIRAVYKNDLPLDFETGDNSLAIAESNKFVVSLFAGKKSEFELTLYLPQHIYREISIYTGSGSIKIGRVDCGQTRLSTESGNITCENTVALTNITTTSGFIDVNFENIVDGCEILSRKGDAKFTVPGDSSMAVDFETDSGKCETELWNGDPYGSRFYGYNGGNRVIHTVIEHGTLVINIVD
ncbi:MAG: DUF4097 domain-containing protein [Oscillospiraceae bacterium]|nr:DUF4097 domain-containing protein [Oscillospiraceae bacterium]